MNIVSEAHFENIERHIKKRISTAKTTLKICVAWLNFGSYEEIFQELRSRNVKVEIIYNSDFINQKNISLSLTDVEFYPISARYSQSIMHNKFCIIDDEILITGSFNWSKRASLHFENIVIIKNDFNLIGAYLHEFEDLKDFYFSQRDKKRCGFQINFIGNACRNLAYNLGVFGQESGKYEESLVAVWRVCTAGHIQFISEHYEQYLSAQLGTNSDDYDDDRSNDKESMLTNFSKERRSIKNVQDYFYERHKVEIHAIGYLVMTNEHEHIEWGDHPTYEIRIMWKDMYHRKTIPNALHDYRLIEEVLKKHTI